MDTQDKLSDDQVKEYAANIIAENMLTQVDSDGMRTPTDGNHSGSTKRMKRRNFNTMTNMSKPRMGGASQEDHKRLGATHQVERHICIWD